MIVEALTWLWAWGSGEVPAWVRRSGYLHESIAIQGRQRRCREAWAPHLASSQAIIGEAIELCPRRQTAIVLGAGLLYDIPIERLTGAFERVVLVDLVHLWPARSAARRYGAALMSMDVTGCVGAWMDGGPLKVSPPTAFLGDAHIDLVVSANICSQLPILPLQGLASSLNQTQADALARQLIEAHLAWLDALPGVRCLITDVVEEVLDPQGSTLESDSALYGVTPPPGGRRWIWDLAPLGEDAPDHSLRHQVGGWICPPGQRLTQANPAPQDAKP